MEYGPIYMFARHLDTSYHIYSELGKDVDYTQRRRPFLLYKIKRHLGVNWNGNFVILRYVQLFPGI